MLLALRTAVRVARSAPPRSEDRVGRAGQLAHAQDPALDARVRSGIARGYPPCCAEDFARRGSATLPNAVQQAACERMKVFDGAFAMAPCPTCAQLVLAGGELAFAQRCDWDRRVAAAAGTAATHPDLGGILVNSGAVTQAQVRLLFQKLHQRGGDAPGGALPPAAAEVVPLPRRFGRAATGAAGAASRPAHHRLSTPPASRRISTPPRAASAGLALAPAPAKAKAAARARSEPRRADPDSALERWKRAEWAKTQERIRARAEAKAAGKAQAKAAVSAPANAGTRGRSVRKPHY